VYEPAKISFFLEMVWERFPAIEKHCLTVDEDSLLELNEAFKAITNLIREIKVLTDKSIDSTEKASILFDHIKISCAHFLSIYFSIRLGHLSTSQPSTN
jgi:hypothetical protein